MNDRPSVAMLTFLLLQDLKPTNILLQLENPSGAISQYLAEVPRRTGPQRGTTAPLREVITTPLVSEMEKPHIRIIDFGVGRYAIALPFAHRLILSSVLAG